MSMNTNIFVFFFSLVIRGVFSFFKQVHNHEWRFVVYLKECLPNVWTHGHFVNGMPIPLSSSHFT
jgi:hypothetical protein